MLGRAAVLTLASAASAWVTLLAVGAATASATCANQVYDEVLPITAASPADGASFQTGITTTPVVFSLRTPVHNTLIYLEVATQNVPGQDGTLANDYQSDFVGMSESDADPDLYTRSLSAAFSTYWTNTPGTLLLAGPHGRERQPGGSRRMPSTEESRLQHQHRTGVPASLAVPISVTIPASLAVPSAAVAIPATGRRSDAARRAGLQE